jgi:uncharacterized protein (TIGR00297 family)
MLIRLAVGLAVDGILVPLSVRRGMLTLPAALGAAVLLLVILAFGGYAAAVYMLTVYLLCALVHLLNKKKRNRHTDGARGLWQVAVNGGVGGVALCLYAALPHPALLAAYYAAVAEFFTDTMASDIGTLSSRTPFDPFRMKKTVRGTSGGMTPLGTAAAFLAALLAALLSLGAGLSLAAAAIVGGAAFLGMLADSALGSLLQAKYVCTVCGAYTEKGRHCGASARKTGGIALLDNSAVNLICTVIAALLAGGAVLLLQ